MQQNLEKFFIENFEFKQNELIKFNFMLLDASLENKILDIRIYDPLFRVLLYGYKAGFSKNTSFWAGTGSMPFSNLITFSVYDNDQEIFSKTFTVNKNIENDILKKFPYLLNYEAGLVEKFLIEEIYIHDTYYNKLTPIKKFDVVVDIGSNLGLFTYYALKNKASKIYCCEPNLSCLKVLKDHFDVYPHVFINNYAISNKNEDKELILLGENAGGNFLADNEQISWHHRNYQTQKIKGIKFLDFIKLNNIDFIDFLKVDCEGGEHDIFVEENRYYISENVHKIVLEYHGKHDNLVEFFGKNNFIFEVNQMRDNLGMIYAKNKKFLDII